MHANNAALLVVAVLLTAMGVAAFLAGEAVAEPCFTVGRTTFCDARSAGKTVGSSLIFNQGRPGRRVGRFIIVEEDGLPRTRGQIGREANDGRFSETRPAGTVPPLLDNSNFGSYAVSRSSRFAPLQRSGPN